MLGQTVSHYQVLEELGHGGMGAVYRARDLKLHRDVALKFLTTPPTGEEEVKRRFIREAKAASALDHPSICPIYEIDETADGRMFIAMAYCHGETLRKKISQGPLDTAKALDIASQTASGLAQAHQRGIVHRGIKPANIIISDDGVARIVDFGLARLAGQVKVTRTGAMVGTMAYISPEQAGGGRVDQHSDIWSLGVVLYEMVTGQLPFRGEQEQAVVHSILHDDPSSASDLRPGIPAELDAVIHRTLAREASSRYSSATELAADLQRIIKIESGEVKTLPGARRGKGPRKQMRKRKRWAAILSAILLFSIVACAVYYGIVNLKASSAGGTGDSENAPVIGNTAGIGDSAAPTAAASGEADGLAWKSSIAILPFRDSSPNRDQEHFCYGMVEAISEKLSRIGELKVTSPRATMRYADGATSIREIGRELGVATVLEGSVLRNREHLRLIVRLVDTADESTIWSDIYTLDLTNSFEIQDEVSVTIARELQVTLNPLPHQVFQDGRPTNQEAYEYYLRARHYSGSYSHSADETDFNAAISMLDKAMELEPDYVLGYVGYAYAHIIRNVITGDATLEDWAQVTKYAEKAYDLNPDLAETNTCMGYIRWNMQDPDEAYRYYKRAFEINPNMWDVPRTIGLFLWTYGLNRNAIKHFELAVEIDPFDYKDHLYLADNYTRVGEWEKAWEHIERASEIAPDSGEVHMRYIVGYVTMGEYDKAEEALIAAKEKNPEHYWHPYSESLLLAARGERDAALALDQNPFVYALLGMTDEAIEGIEKIAAWGHGFPYDHYASWITLTNCPFYASLRDDPRFLEIVKRQREVYDERLKKYGDL